MRKIILSSGDISSHKNWVVDALIQIGLVILFASIIGLTARFSGFSEYAKTLDYSFFSIILTTAFFLMMFNQITYRAHDFILKKFCNLDKVNLKE